MEKKPNLLFYTMNFISVIASNNVINKSNLNKEYRPPIPPPTHYYNKISESENPLKNYKMYIKDKILHPQV